MRALIIALIGVFSAAPLFAQTFGLGENTSTFVTASVNGPTFGLEGLKVETSSELQVSEPQTVEYEIVGYQQVCEGGVCRVQPIRRAINRTATAVVKATTPRIVLGPQVTTEVVATELDIPLQTGCGCGCANCTCAPASAMAPTEAAIPVRTRFVLFPRVRGFFLRR